MSRSRVQTRISLRSVFAEDAAGLAVPEDTFAEPGGEDSRGSGFSGKVEEQRCFWSERSILVTVLFIARALRRAPVAISFFAQRATGHAKPLPVRFSPIRERFTPRSQAVWLKS